jgi:hypothetical protein
VTTRFAVINAKTGVVVNAGLTYEHRDLADMAALDLSLRYPEHSFTVADLIFEPAVATI